MAVDDEEGGKSEEDDNGKSEKEVEALNVARKLAILNSEIIHFVKNDLKYMDKKLEKKLKNKVEQHKILTNTKFGNVDVDSLIANPTNNENHNLTKLDVEWIKDVLLENDDVADKDDDEEFVIGDGS